MNLQQAERKQAKIKLGIQGPSGAGKTYSALLIAFGMTKDWSKIAVIDTENHSDDLYAHLGSFNVLALDKPFTPERYIEAIETCEQAGMQVIAIDSISHEWEGSGGILDIHGAMMGNSFTNWSRITPRHNDFVQKILQSPCHIIATIRSKQDYVISEKNGKMVPEKVGLKGVTSEGADYELTMVFELDIKHQATSTKDRTGLFMDKPSFQISAETGQIILNWCKSGKSLEAVKEMVHQAATVDELRNIIRQYPDYRHSNTKTMTETIKQRKTSVVIDHSEGALKEAIKFARIIKDPSLIGCIQRLRSRWHSEDNEIHLYDDLKFSLYFEILNRATDTLILNGGIIYHGRHDAYGAGGIARHVCLTPTEGWSIHT